MAVEAAAKTGFPGIGIHGKSIRVGFMHKGVRHRHTLQYSCRSMADG